MRRLLPAAAAAVLFAAVTVLAADPAPDWSKFADSGEVVGDVVKVTDTAITVRTKKLVPQGRGKPKEENDDRELNFADGALIRWKKEPPKKDDKGNKVPHTSAEMEALRKPAGAPGFAADKSDLAAKIVQVKLVRPRDISAKKAQPADLMVKYVIILGDDPTPAAPPKETKKEVKKEEVKKPETKKPEDAKKDVAKKPEETKKDGGK